MLVGILAFLFIAARNISEEYLHTGKTHLLLRELCLWMFSQSHSFGLSRICLQVFISIFGIMHLFLVYFSISSSLYVITSYVYVYVLGVRFPLLATFRKAAICCQANREYLVSAGCLYASLVIALYSSSASFAVLYCV